MKEIFAAFGRYNRKTNGIIYGYIEKMSFAQMSSCIKAYYKNIMENTFHVMRSDVKWLGRLSQFRKSGITNEALAIFQKEDKVDEGLVFQNLGKYLDTRAKADEEIIALMDSIPEGDFLKIIEIPFGQGQLKLETWKLLLQWFNHHTHHRGQVSIQLDLLGIDHDFSGMIDKIG
jgi:uncharacterized damage-inducible protein DinB